MAKELFRTLSSVTHFQLPAIPSSIPFECHPNFAFISNKVHKWAIDVMGNQDLDKMKKLLQCRLAMFTPMIIPRGNCERLVLASQHTWLLFIFDDYLEGMTGCKEEYNAVKSKAMLIATGEYKNDVEVEERPALWAAFDDIMSKMRSQMLPSLFIRYLDVLSKYMDCVGEEVTYKKNNIIMEPTSFRLVRRKTTFMEAVGCLWGEFCMDVQLKQKDIQSSTFIDFVDSIIDHTGMVNDLLSFRGDYYDKSSHNWLCVLFYHGKGISTFQDAVHALCKMITNEETRILKLQKILQDEAIKFNDEDLMKFAIAHPFVASGNLRWSYITPRYHGYNNPCITGEPFHGTWFMHPKATIVLPNHIIQTHRFLMDDTTSEVE